MTQALTLFDIGDVPAVTIRAQKAVTLQDIRQEALYGVSHVTVFTDTNWYTTYKGRGEASLEYDTWDAAIALGKGYMVGDRMTTDQYLRNNTRSLNRWQKLAYVWALANPKLKLILQTQRREWHVRVRGDHVEFSLPHHGLGGEQDWISRDGKTFVLVSTD